MDDNLVTRVRRRARLRAAAALPPDVAAVADVPAVPVLADQRCGLRLPEGWLFALHVPGDGSPITLIVVRDSAAGISDALGGVLLDACAVDGVPTHRCWVYLDSDRHDRRPPRNRQLSRLGVALGWPRDRFGDWLGPAVVTGRDLHWADRDLPSVVLAAALPVELTTT